MVWMILMGCFPYTCSVSSLPIQRNDPVRFLALARNPLNEGRSIVRAGDGWQPITVPLHAAYDEYGSVTGIEDSPVTDAFFAALNTRIMERCVGNNPAHDVQVKRGMSRKLWLRALWEGRVRVEDLHSGTWLQVVQTMIREDIWQHLVAECRCPQGDLERLVRSPFLMGPFENLRIGLVDDGLLPVLVELFRVQASLDVMGRQWAQGATGPQGGEAWSANERFASAVLAISRSQRSAPERDS